MQFPPRCKMSSKCLRRRHDGGFDLRTYQNTYEWRDVQPNSIGSGGRAHSGWFNSTFFRLFSFCCCTWINKQREAAKLRWTALEWTPRSLRLPSDRKYEMEFALALTSSLQLNLELGFSATTRCSPSSTHFTVGN